MNIIDLTLPIYEGMQTFPSRNHPRIKVSALGRLSMDGRNTTKITIGSHTGTHIDAPAHFLAGGKTIDGLSMKDLVGEARIIDLTFIRPGQPILKEHLSGLEEAPVVRRVLLRTGWSKKWSTSRYYTDYPYLSPEACRYVVSKKVKLLGLDTPSPDDPKNNFYSGNDSPNHKYLFRHNVILVEYLTNLDKINVNDFSIAALPLPIRGCDGSSARVIAFWR